jgi:hypothetical protein
MGKGSMWRKTDYKKYHENWEKIKTDSKKETSAKEVKKKNGKTTYKYG